MSRTGSTGGGLKEAVQAGDHVTSRDRRGGSCCILDTLSSVNVDRVMELSFGVGQGLDMTSYSTDRLGLA